MATTKKFSTGGGFPYDNSPGRTIEFTLSYGKSGLTDPNSGQPLYAYRTEFSDPEDRAYICAMYGPPRDEGGLNAFAHELGRAYRNEAEDPANKALPVPPIEFTTQYGYDQHAANEVRDGGIARGCLWAQQFGPGTNLSIDLANGAGANTYRAKAINDGNRIMGEQAGSTDPTNTEPYFDTTKLPLWIRDALAYAPQARDIDVASSNQDGAPSRERYDARNVRTVSRRLVARAADDNGVGNGSASPEGIDSTNPMQPPQTGGPLGSISKPVRYLGRRIADQSQASVFDTSAPATTDPQDSVGGRVGNWASSPEGITPRNPDLPVPAPEPVRPLGIFSGKPMPEWPFPPPIWGLPDHSKASGNSDGNWFTSLAGVLDSAKSRASQASGTEDSSPKPVPQISQGSTPSPLLTRRLARMAKPKLKDMSVNDLTRARR
jgi:hypothetical protein